MDPTSDSIFELRTDPTTGRKVLIAEGRALRPNDFLVGDVFHEAHSPADCPFCRGHEHMTPHELAVVNNPQGDWQVRVVPNKFPAVAIGSEFGVPGTEYSAVSTGGEDNLFLRDAAHGVHEVIIESPQHIQDWAELSTEELATVLQVFRERLNYAHTEHQLSSGLIFKNVGEAAGASLEHVHSQLIALPFVPEVLDRELKIASDFQNQNGKCLLCRLLADEIRHGTRVVIENAHFAAICAYAGRQPYETWILPKSHASRFTSLHEEEFRSLAAILREMVQMLSVVLEPLAYNLVLHTAPVGDKRAAAFHWHWELIPRSTSLAGFEWATGMHINSVSPERAAIRLRASKSGEKLPIQ